uniref:Uncharacterized protein n=1 Tax=Acrobeloides nanus TaxID=290746 RepID=A0A914DSH1_9BILA
MSNGTSSVRSIGSVSFKNYQNHDDEWVTIEPDENPDWLIPGEKIQMKEQQIGYLSPDGKIFGRVYITNFRLRFESTEQASNKNS